MPRYHFNLRSGSLIEDRNGTELLGIAAVRKHAIKLARNLIMRIGEPDRDWSLLKIVVTDDEGAEVLAVPVSEARGETLNL